MNVDEGLRDQVSAAKAEARRIVTNAVPGADNVPITRDKPGWASAVVDRLLADPSGQRCKHLIKRPVQPAFAIIWEGHWRCRACMAGNAEEQQQRIRAGTYVGLGAVEEGTCDRCRLEVGPKNLTQTILRVDLWIVVAAICPRCERQLHREGGRTLGG